MNAKRRCSESIYPDQCPSALPLATKNECCSHFQTDSIKQSEPVKSLCVSNKEDATARSSNHDQNKIQHFRVGSRTSELALTQTNLVLDLLQETNQSQLPTSINSHSSLPRNSGLQFNVVTRATLGDRVQDIPLAKIGEKGLFTKELDELLLGRHVDFLVHSFKDLPTTMPEGTVIGAVCERKFCEDVVLLAPPLRQLGCLARLPPGSVIGTSAVRRVAQLRRAYPELQFESVRGNLNTRLRKLDAYQPPPSPESPVREKNNSPAVNFSALILARAGVERLGWASRIDEVLGGSQEMYAVAQGALACQCRADDTRTLELLQSIHDEASTLSCIAERALMRALHGGCSTPLGVRSQPLFSRGDGRDGLAWMGEGLRLSATVWSPDGSKQVQASLCGRLPTEPFVEESDATEKKRLRLVSKSEQQHNSSSAKISIVADCGDAGQLDKEAPEDRHTFLGVHVHPICETGRVRMHYARHLGRSLAERLCKNGATEILDSLQRTPAEIAAAQKVSS